MQILGYYVGWAIDAITKLLNVGLIIFSGKMTCFITKAWSYLEPTVGEMNYAFLDCQLILSKYAALAPSIGAAILSTYPADELIEWKRACEKTRVFSCVLLLMIIIIVILHKKGHNVSAK